MTSEELIPLYHHKSRFFMLGKDVICDVYDLAVILEQHFGGRHTELA